MTTRTLHLGKGLSLPPDAVTQTFAIFGKRGSGKTNGATVIVEELLKAHLPVVILDPVDAWWGLKSSSDGKGPGFPVYIFGGQHGDLPLEPTSGALIADVVATQRLPMVLSMKLWGVAERSRFVTDFAKRLLQVNTEPVMMVLEEADAFIPQRPAKGEEAMLGAMDRLVRWGRQSGVGCTIVTQRSAKVNKDVTTQAETLVAFRTTGPQDREAIDAWIKYHAGDELRQDLLSTLPTLPNGTAWVWSPEWLEVFDRFAFRRRETFDSAATPKVGEKRPKPKQLADVDLDILRSQMAETVERAKADDPRELRKQIAELKKQLAVKTSPVGEKVTGPVRDKPILTDADRALLRSVDERLRGVGGLVRDEFAERLTDFQKAVLTTVDRKMEGFARILESKGLQKVLGKLSAVGSQLPTSPIYPTTSAAVPRSQQARRVAPGPATSRTARLVSPSANGHEPLTPARQKILNALAFLHGIGVAPADKTQLALMVGVSPTSGGYFNNLGALRSTGFIDYPSGGTVALTDTGMDAASHEGVPSTTDELHDAIRAKLPPAKWRIIERLIEKYPGAVSKDELAEEIGVSPASGGYFNNLGSLRSLGLIDYPQPSMVAATPVLFLEQ